MDFALHSNNTVMPLGVDKDGPFDPDDAYECGDDLPLIKQHESICGCSNATACVSVYRRCRIRSRVYHSLLYSRRKSSNSYSVEYEDAQSCRVSGKYPIYSTVRDITSPSLNGIVFFVVLMTSSNRLNTTAC
jgi:hypothetical protein